MEKLIIEGLKTEILIYGSIIGILILAYKKPILTMLLFLELFAAFLGLIALI